MRRSSLLCASTLTAVVFVAGCTGDGSLPVEPGAELHVVRHTLSPRLFGAKLSGAEEVPPVATTGHGLAQFLLSPDGKKLHFRLSTFGVKDVTQAHIHLGERGVNGPVVAFLFGFVAEGVTVNGLLSTGTITEDDIIPRDGFDGTMSELLQRMRSGRAYVNVHTLAYPPGEVRGQIAVLKR